MALDSRRVAKILFVDTVAEKGGAQTAMLSLLLRLDRTRFLPYVALLSDGPFADELRSQSIPICIFSSHRLRDLRRSLGAISWLCRLISTERIDLVHSNGTKSHVYAATAAWRTKRPVIWQVYDPPSPKMSRIDSLASRLPCAHVVPIMESSWQPFAKHVGCVPVTTIHPGVCLDELDAYMNHLTPLQQQRHPLIVMCARLQAFKGHRFLIGAAPKIVAQFPTATIRLIGGSLFGLEPEYPKTLERLISDLGLSDSVQLTGYVSREEYWRWMLTADIVAHPALNEPFGLVIAEAMALGRPVVATQVSGPSLLVEHGKTGLLVPPADSSALADAILSLLWNPQQSQYMGAAGRVRIQAFTAEQTAVNMQTVYERVLSRDYACASIVV